ncbi:hypothetical protein KSP39_PZI003215 [Platanthera zijinensis]|uniref:Uncharacterized protein n=1 Tax=Platanthera zijinensis TaxID=2320716 RepID=A0AAP0BXP8_9ASPA
MAEKERRTAALVSFPAMYTADQKQVGGFFFAFFTGSRSRSKQRGRRLLQTGRPIPITAAVVAERTKGNVFLLFPIRTTKVSSDKFEAPLLITAQTKKKGTFLFQAAVKKIFLNLFPPPLSTRRMAAEQQRRLLKLSPFPIESSDRRKLFFFFRFDCSDGETQAEAVAIFSFPDRNRQRRVSSQSCREEQFSSQPA